MVTLGIDAHKRSPTVVAVDRQGRPLGIKTVGTNTKYLWCGLLRTAVTCLAASSAICSGLVRPSCGLHRS